MHPISRVAASLALLGCLALPSCAQNPAADVVVESKPKPGALPISPLLGGGQFNFFSTPIKERHDNQAMLDDWKSAKISCLRYPGGTWGDHYVWDHPENSYFVVKEANANTIVSPEEFVGMCRKIGAEPIFQANALVRGERSSNWINPTKIEDIREGAKWSAEWVRQANKVNHWGIKYWEIGNELWIMYRPEEYATILKEYSIAMKAVDPSIKTIACGLSSTVGPFKLEWFNFKDDPNWKIRMANTNDAASWNEALFTIAKGYFDYIAPHPYISAKTPKDSRDTYLQTIAKVWDEEGLKTQYDALKKYDSPAQIAVTEWATNFGSSVSASRSLKFPLYFYSMGNGVNSAHYLGQIVSGERNGIAVLHSLDEVQNLYFWPKKAMADKPLSHPNYLALKLWNTHLGTRRTTMTVAKQPMLTIGEKTYPATFTFASEDDKNLYLFAINLDPDSPHRFEWKPQGMKATSGTLTSLTGKSLDADNWATWNQEKHDIDLVDSPLSAQNGAFSFQMPAYSVAGLTVPKQP